MTGIDSFINLCIIYMIVNYIGEKMLKKLISIFLILTTFASLLIITGCRGNSGNPQTTASGTTQTPSSAQNPYSPSQELTGGIVNPYIPLTTSNAYKYIREIAAAYPNAVSVKSIGSSVRSQDIPLVMLGFGEKKILFVAGVHPTEYIASNYALVQIETLAKFYTNKTNFGDYNVNAVLSGYTLYFVPMANPDGLDIVTGDKVSDWRANENGVNINKNFPHNIWNRIDTGVTSAPPRNNWKDYKGPSAGSEPETQALVKLTKENHFEFVCTFHTQGELVFWRDGNAGALKNDSALTDFICAQTGYIKNTPITSTNDMGGFENYFRITYKRPALCVEMTPYIEGEPHNDAKFDSLIWNKKNVKYLIVSLVKYYKTL